MCFFHQKNITRKVWNGTDIRDWRWQGMRLGLHKFVSQLWLKEHWSYLLSFRFHNALVEPCSIEQWTLTTLLPESQKDNFVDFLTSWFLFATFTAPSSDKIHNNSPRCESRLKTESWIYCFFFCVGRPTCNFLIFNESHACQSTGACMLQTRSTHLYQKEGVSTFFPR